MQKNLSIFNFKLPRSFLLSCFFLLIFDFIASTYIHLVPDSHDRLSNFLWRGYSTLGRIRYTVLSRKNINRCKIYKKGWLESHDLKVEWKGEKIPDSSAIKVLAYGQSFTGEVLSHFSKINPTIKTLFFDAPDAPPSWCYAMYKSSRRTYPSHVRIIGMHETEIPALLSLCHATFGPVSGYPYTYPKFEIDNGKLIAMQPAIRSLEELQSALETPGKINVFIKQLAEKDEFFNALIFKENILDYSIIARSLRYRLILRHVKLINSKIAPPYELDEGKRALSVLKSIIVNFASDCYAEGSLPVVILFSQEGTGNNFKDILRDTVKESGIVCIATSDIFNVNDPSNFIEGDHYKPEINKMIAQEAVNVILKSLNNIKKQNEKILTMPKSTLSKNE